MELKKPVKVEVKENSDMDNLRIDMENRLEVLSNRLDRISKELNGHFGFNL